MKNLIVLFLIFTFSLPALSKEKAKKRMPAARSGYAAHAPINMFCTRGQDSIAFVAGKNKKSLERIDVILRGKKYSFDQIGGIFSDGMASSDYPHNKYLAGNAQNEIVVLEYSNGDGFGALGTRPEDNAFVAGLYIKEKDNRMLTVNADDGIPLSSFPCKKMK